MFIQLKKITLENFRCFGHVELNLSTFPNNSTKNTNFSGTTVLVAKNGQGKTAILDAINYLLGIMLSRLPNVPTPKVNPKTDFRQIWKHDGVQLIALPPEPYMRLAVEAIDDLSNEIKWDKVVKLDRSVNVQHLLPESLSTKGIFKFADRIMDCVNAYAPRELFPVISFYNTKRAVNWKKPDRRHFLQKRLEPYDGYRGTLNGELNYKKMLEWFSYLEDKQRRKIVDFRNFDFVTTEQQTIELAIQKMLPGFAHLKTVTNPIDLAIDEFDEETDEWQQIRVGSQLSDGFKIVLVLTLDIVSRILELNAGIANITPEQLLQTPGIVLIDEIEQHLHPSWQQHILRDLQSTFPNIQFIVSTHSPQIVASVPKECVRIIDHGQLQTFDNQTQGVSVENILLEIFGIQSLLTA